MAEQTGPEAASVAVATLAETSDEYLVARDMYTGDRREVFASNSIRRMLAKSGDAYRVNFADKPVDTVVERLEVLSFAVVGEPDGDGNPTVNEEATRRLYEVWDACALRFQLPDLFTKASYFGDQYAVVWPHDEDVDDEIGDPDDDSPKMVDVTQNTPLVMRVFYDPLNPTRKTHAVRVWRQGSKQADPLRANVYWPDRIEKYVTVKGAKGKKATDWAQWLADPEDDDSWLVDNPWGLPVFHFRTALPYGDPLHAGAFGAQDAINKLTISHMASVDFVLLPQRAALLEPDNVDDAFAADDDLENPFDDGVATNPDANADETTQSLRSGPGELWWMRNVKSLTQLPAAESSNFTDPIEFYLTLMAEKCDMTLDCFRPSGGNESGESRRRADSGKVKKAERLQQMYGSELSAMFAFALKVLGYDDVRVDVRWAPAEIVTDREGWETVREKIRAGVPVRVAMLEAGYAADQVDEWFPDDDAAGIVNMEQMQQLADVLQKLGAAVSLGILSEREARALLPPDALG